MKASLRKTDYVYKNLLESQWYEIVSSAFLLSEQAIIYSLDLYYERGYFDI